MTPYWNDIYLSRLLDNGKQTLGFLHFFDGMQSVGMNTLELPWKNNREDESCIPPGSYPWKKYNSPTKGMVILLEDVPGREWIEIHIANYVRQLKGCIAVGLGVLDIDGDGLPDMEDSKKAFDKLMSLLPEKGHIHIDDEHVVRI